MMIGAVLGKYRVTDEISAGGMGTVYRAQHELLGRPAAVKLLRPDLTANADLVPLTAAHAKGIIHRDLEPDNVFLVPDPDVAGGERLPDSVGKTATGALMGTPLALLLEKDPANRYQSAAALSDAIGRTLGELSVRLSAEVGAAEPPMPPTPAPTPEQQIEVRTVPVPVIVPEKKKPKGPQTDKGSPYEIKL